MERDCLLREEMPRFYPNIDYFVLSGVGSLAPLEAPEELAKTIAALITPS